MDPADPGQRLRKTRYAKTERARTPVIIRMMINVVRCLGALATLDNVLRTRDAAFPITGTDGSSRRGMKRGPGWGVGVGVAVG